VRSDILLPASHPRRLSRTIRTPVRTIIFTILPSIRPLACELNGAVIDRIAVQPLE
jgi:hypothetical protein